MFDVADAIDLGRLQRELGAGKAARLAPKPTTPPYVQYRQPPIAVDGRAIDMPETDGFSVRLKAFEYGVISVALVRPMTGTWAEWIAWGRRCQDNPELPRSAEHLARRLVQRIAPAITRSREEFLAEDYFIFTVTATDAILSADALLASHGASIAQLLRGERSALSTEERDEVLRHHISYFEDDLVIPTWSSAFIRDTESGAQAA